MIAASANTGPYFAGALETPEYSIESYVSFFEFQALLGAQLVITLIMVSVIQKLSPHFSLARWILCSTGLTRYLHPTDDELKKLSGVPREKSKGKKDKRNGHHHQLNGEKASSFHIPRNLDIQLETTPISPYDVVHLRFYTEYQWLVDFSLYAAIVYSTSEVKTKLALKSITTGV